MLCKCTLVMSNEPKVWSKKEKLHVWSKTTCSSSIFLTKLSLRIQDQVNSFNRVLQVVAAHGI